MTVLINGEHGSALSVYDRGLLYGQSLFETIAIADEQACLLTEHMQRLQAGAAVLGIPFDLAAVQADISTLATGQQKAVIRATLTMGEGGRGYLNPSEPQACRIVSLHSYPEHPQSHWQSGIELGLAEIRLGQQAALAGLKHGNRLEQIIARSQWQPSWHEALLLDQQNHVIEATQSNIFVLKGEQLTTPDLSLCGVNGVMREFVLSQANKLGVQARCMSLSVADIEQADAVFVCNSVIGLWPVKQFFKQRYNDFTLATNLLDIMIKNGAIPNI